MKKAILAFSILASVISSWAQGIITFFSLNQAVKPFGEFTAGLFLASDLNNSLGTTDFVPGTGYLNAIDVTVPGFPVGSSSAQFVVRGWETGKTYATSTARGQSQPFTTGALGGPQPPNPPATPPDLGPNFQLTIMPEPSTYALGALGLGALALMRRRK